MADKNKILGLAALPGNEGAPADKPSKLKASFVTVVGLMPDGYVHVEVQKHARGVGDGVTVLAEGDLKIVPTVQGSSPAEAFRSGNWTASGALMDSQTKKMDSTLSLSGSCNGSDPDKAVFRRAASGTAVSAPVLNQPFASPAAPPHMFPKPTCPAP